jgi:hypothetical protein
MISMEIEQHIRVLFGGKWGYFQLVELLIEKCSIVVDFPSNQPASSCTRCGYVSYLLR